MESRNVPAITPEQAKRVWRKSHEPSRRTRHRSTDPACPIACLLVHSGSETGSVWKVTIFPRDSQAYEEMSALLDEEKLSVHKSDAGPLLGCSLAITPTNGKEVLAFLTVLNRIAPDLNSIDDEDIQIAIGLQEKKLAYCHAFFDGGVTRTHTDPLFDKSAAVGEVMRYMGLGL